MIITYKNREIDCLYNKDYDSLDYYDMELGDLITDYEAVKDLTSMTEQYLYEERLDYRIDRWITWE